MSEGKGLSRRDFLKAFSAIPVAAGVLGAPNQAKAEEKPPKVLGPGPTPITLNVNGKDHALQLPPRTTLLNALRTYLDLTGAKEVCNTGACGACTVLVDGLPMNACLLLAVDAVGRKIVTVEALAKDEGLAPIQQAFVTHDGMQCGYCTPGFLCSLSALFAKKPNPTSAEIRSACSGNLCRCGAYPRIFAAAEAVAAGKPDGGGVHGEALLALGGEALRKVLDSQGVPRIEGVEKVTGRAKYSSDQRPSGLLYMRALICPYASARIDGRPDLDAARMVPGVKTVELVSDRETQMGAPVAYAVADDPQAADEALAALGLKLSPQPRNVDPEKAFADAARGPMEPSGRVKRALDDADAVVEGTFVIQTVQHCALEPHGAVAHWQGDRLTVYESTQAVCGARDEIAEAAGLPQGKTRLLCEFTGGGFGAKLGMWSETPRLLRVAKRAGAPVHYFASRAAELIAYGGRRPQVVQVRMGGRKDGQIVGECRRLLGNADTYWYDVPVSDTDKLKGNVHGFGTFPPLRAPGSPERSYVMESIVEDLANALGIDPLEMRLRNKPDMKNWFEQGARAIGWSRREPTGSQKGEVRRGFGVGCGNFAGMSGCHFAEVEVDMPTGVVRVVKVVAVMQGGFINRLGVLNQILGGTVMGLSWAMFEERILDRVTGGVLNANLDGYKIAGTKDVPEIEVILIGQQGRTSGVGEAPVVPIAGAIRNAIVNATGKPIYRMPFTPRNVLASLA